MIKLISNPIRGLAVLVVTGLAVFGAVQLSLSGQPNNVPAHFNVQTTPVNREAHGVTSYAPIIKRAAPSVVNIYSTRTIKLRRMPMNPFFGD
ncbi:MAG: hypothetical protein ACTHLW_02490, partial [Verrucomicrobiota bacterium]